MILKPVLLAGALAVSGCGMMEKKDKKDKKSNDDGIALQQNQGPKGDTGPQGPKGDVGAQGQKGDTGSKGDQGDAGDSYSRSLNGFFESPNYFLNINETFYEKTYKQGDFVLRESGITTEFGDKLMFQPKVFECGNGEETTEYTDRDIAEQVNNYRDLLIANAYQTLNDLFSEQDDLPTTIETKQREIADHLSEVAAAQSAFDAASVAVDMSQENLDVLRNGEMVIIMDAIAAKEQLSTENADKIDVASTKVEVANSEVELIQSERDASAQNLAAKEEERAMNQSALDTKTAEVAAKFDEITSLSSNIATVAAQISQKQEAIDTEENEERRSVLRAELNILKSQMASLENQKSSSESEHEQLQAQVNQLVITRDQLSDAWNSIANELAEIDSRLTAKHEELSLLSGELSQIQTEQEELLNSIADLNAQLTSLKESEADLVAQHEQLETNKAESAQTLADVSAVHEEKWAQLTALEERYASMETLIADQRTAITTMEATDLYKVQDYVAEFSVSQDQLIVGLDSLIRTKKNISNFANVECMDAFGYLFGHLNQN